MTLENAEFTFMALFVVACFIWMLSLWFALRIGECKPSVWQDYEKFHGPSGEVPSGIPAKRLLTRIKKLMNDHAKSIGAIKFRVAEESDRMLTIRKLGPMACNLPTGLIFSSANFEIANQNGKQVVRYQADQKPIFAVFKKIALGICLFLGIPMLMVLSAVIWYFCVQSNNASMRFQVVQMLQMIHVLWPPFLFAFTTWLMRRGVKSYLKKIVEYAADSEIPDAELDVSFVTGIPKSQKLVPSK